jgi:glycosyltransferase involved in cell wall biosynthesis
MLRITALLYTENDELRIGRCLETLYPCDEILVVDHASSDATSHLAREYGARIISPWAGTSAVEQFSNLVGDGWILCLDPRESLSEALAASLFDWKTDCTKPGSEAPPVSLFVREEKGDGWIEHAAAQTRLVPSNWNHWQGRFPINHESATPLDGKLLRFAFP